MTGNDTLLGNLHFESEIVRWERDLRGAELPHVFLKGIGFDRWLDRSRTRVPRDIDLLCPRRAKRPLARLLKDRAYRCVVTEPNASTWLSADNRIPIDLHDTLKGATVSPDAVWSVVARSVDYVDVAGIPVPVLGPPARELVAGLHLALGGVDDDRARADLVEAVVRSSPETWLAANELARELGCQALFQAGFGATLGLRAFATSLGFAMVGADELLAPRSGRNDAIGLLPALVAGSAFERVRLGSRFLRLHAARLDLGEPVVTDGTGSDGWYRRITKVTDAAWNLGLRLFHALVGAHHLRQALRLREND
jgi:Uncharacterised nucleotidyltransferase